MAGERAGIPSIGVMTSQFVSAAELMARVLGAEGHRFVVIDHPISSASAEALEVRARGAVAEGIGLLLGTGWARPDSSDAPSGGAR